MAVLPSQVFFPGGFPELFATWKHFPNAEIIASGFERMMNQGGRLPVLPANIISLDKLGEMRRITRTERYLEIGAMVRLNQIIQLGKIVPEVLSRCLTRIGDAHIRNLITIGGNLCCPTRRLDTSAPMIALDAQFELRTAQSVRWVPASRFSSLPGPLALEPQELLTRIRVPLEPWTYTWYRKLRTFGGNEPGSGILFIMRNEKNILTDIRIIYSGQTILREKNSETMLTGKRLPLERRDVSAFVDRWKTYLSSFEGNEKNIFAGANENINPELTKKQIVNFIESILMHITD